MEKNINERLLLDDQGHDHEDWLYDGGDKNKKATAGKKGEKAGEEDEPEPDRQINIDATNAQLST